MVEVGTTNRTHLRDYEQAVTEATAVIFRAHPSNYRIQGFTKEVPLAQLVALAHGRGLVMVDDLGAGALVGLERFGLPHEPTMQESIAAGADVVLASADKLIGASQGGVIVGRRDCVERIRKHPLARALRVDKTCLMALERTLGLFRDGDRLVREHPTYRMLAAEPAELRARAEALAEAVRQAAPAARTEIVEGVGFLGSGSLPMEELPTFLLAVEPGELGAEDLARRLRMDEACVFARIEAGRVLLDVRTMTDEQVPQVAAAVARAAP
jgi:L-seryl-tRNA(Ser) seleniumtransferase